MSGAIASEVGELDVHAQEKLNWPPSMYEPKRTYRVLGENNWNKLPQIIRDDLLSILDEVSDFHHQRKSAEIWVALRNRGIEIEKTFKLKGYSHAKKVNGYIEAQHTRVVVEIESSTIENAYNDTLKILALKEAGLIDFGVILAKYNPKRKSLSYEQMSSPATILSLAVVAKPCGDRSGSEYGWSKASSESLQFWNERIQ